MEATHGGWAQFTGDNPYQERYGDGNWEMELANSPQMKKMRYVHQLTTLFYLYEIIPFTHFGTET
jgi:hypothetical protein